MTEIAKCLTDVVQVDRIHTWSPAKSWQAHLSVAGYAYKNGTDAYTINLVAKDGFKKSGLLPDITLSSDQLRDLIRTLQELQAETIRYAKAEIAHKAYEANPHG